MAERWLAGCGGGAGGTDLRGTCRPASHVCRSDQPLSIWLPNLTTTKNNKFALLKLVNSARLRLAPAFPLAGNSSRPF